MANSQDLIKYYYTFDKPIFVNPETVDLTPFSFQKDGSLYEKDSLLLFFNKIDPNKNFNIVDIGAQTGLYTLYAKYLPKSKFYAFEPFPKSLEILNKNLSINNIKNVETFPFALNDKSGKSKLNVCKSHNGLHTMGNPIRFKDISIIDIETKTIDELFYDQEIPVHFIKIDTEGCEYSILRGATKTIKTFKPIIQLEWNPINQKQFDVTPDMFFDLFFDLDYHITSLYNEEMIIECL